MDGKTKFDSRSQSQKLTIVLTMIFTMFSLVSFSGCVGFTSTLGYWLYGNKAKAEYNSLRDKKVAVVVLSDSNAYGPDNSTTLLTSALRMKLAREVQGIKLISNNEVESWVDSNFDVIDYAEIGKAVKADRVIAIDLENYGLYDGQTLYKGTATYTVSIIDMEKDGEITFRRGPKDFQFPSTHGKPTTSMSEVQFERHFVSEMAEMIARYFYEYELHSDIARDPAHMGP